MSILSRSIFGKKQRSVSWVEGLGRQTTGAVVLKRVFYALGSFKKARLSVGLPSITFLPTESLTLWKR